MLTADRWRQRERKVFLDRGPQKWDLKEEEVLANEEGNEERVREGETCTHRGLEMRKNRACSEGHINAHNLIRISQFVIILNERVSN